MTFPEKSALTMTAVLVAVFGWYFWLVLGPIAGAGSSAREFAYTAVMGVALAAVTVLATVSHIILAIVFHRQANVRDERDRLISLRSSGLVRRGGRGLARDIAARQRGCSQHGDGQAAPFSFHSEPPEIGCGCRSQMLWVGALLLRS